MRTELVCSFILPMFVIHLKQLIKNEKGKINRKEEKGKEGEKEIVYNLIIGWFRLKRCCCWGLTTAFINFIANWPYLPDISLFKLKTISDMN